MKMKIGVTEPINMKELATLIYGVFNIITSGVLSACCIVGYLSLSRDLQDTAENLRFRHTSDPRKEVDHTLNLAMMTIVLLLAVVITMVWLSSSVILIIGIYKKKSGYVKFFFIYTITLCVVSAIAAIADLCSSWMDDYPLSGGYILLGTFVYSLPLLCVYDTFVYYESGMAQQFKSNKLIEG